MKLQNFKYEVVHIKGKDNIFADAQSRGIISFQEETASLKSIEQKETSEENKRYLIMKAHQVLGHGGILSTYAFVRQNHNWKYLYDDL
ncbi:hypothetical protein ENBRE01_1681 [Enteropsectra breve]|nr:hypothetical protein ENBRE01_1681 [Enteropsectra breve]